MAEVELSTPRGILNQQEGAKRFQLDRYLPAPDLSFFVEYYWVVSWDLTGQPPYRQEILSHPCVHLVFERDSSKIFGVVKGKFVYLLRDQGRVFGIRFRPGAFYPFIQVPVSRYTDRAIRVEEVFGAEAKALEGPILDPANRPVMPRLADEFLRSRLPAPDENVEVVSRIVERIIQDREITRVEDVAASLHLNKRTLQRLFNQYVGVSPKWVIKRARVQEAAEQLASGKVVDWSRLVSDLGYFDQAHFIRDFKTIVGTTPLEYVRQVGLARL